MANATRTAQAIHAQVTNLPQPPRWANYWTFVTATIILMFILYTAQKGTLSTWIGFLAWSNPATPTAPNAGSTTPAVSSQGAATVANNAAAQASGATSGAATTFGGLPTGGNPVNFGQVFQQLFGAGAYSANSTPVTTPTGSGGIGSA